MPPKTDDINNMMLWIMLLKINAVSIYTQWIKTAFILWSIPAFSVINTDILSIKVK